MKKKLLAILAVLFLAPGIAGAGPIYGQVWLVTTGGGIKVQNGPGWDPILANVPASAPALTFYADRISFNTDTSYEIGDFLASSGATNIVQNSSFTENVLNLDMNKNWLIQGLTYPDGWEFFMTLSSAGMFDGDHTYSVSHDDGFSLYLDGALYLDKSTATSEITNTFSGVSGYHDWTLVYGEVNGRPGVLEADLPVPEPASMLLLGSGLLGLAMAARRRSRK